MNDKTSNGVYFVNSAKYFHLELSGIHYYHLFKEFLLFKTMLNHYITLK